MRRLNSITHAHRLGLISMLGLLLPLISSTPAGAASAADCAGPPTLLPIPDMRAHVGFPIDYQATAAQMCGAARWETLSAPRGFSIDGAGGRFYWTPSEPGSSTIVIQMSSSQDGYAARETRSFQITVDDNTITSPPFREYLSEPASVPIMGRAHGPDFVSYSVDYAELGRPRTRRRIAGPITTPMESAGKLANWDVSGLKDGSAYLLNLRVALSDGTTSVVTNPVIIDRSIRPGWPKRVGPITHSVVLADLDDDGRQEVLAVTHFGELYVWRIDGTLLWKAGQFGAAYGAPSVGDIDGDGRPEIVWATIYALYAYHPDGSPVAGFPVAAPEGTELRTTPTLADLDGDGRLDVIVGARSSSVERPGQVWAYGVSASGPQVLRGWPREVSHFSLYGGASVADLDGDGVPEVVVESFNQVHAWHANGVPVGSLDGAALAAPIDNVRVNSGGTGYSSSQPAIADLDGDGRAEIVIGSNVLRANGTPLPGWEGVKRDAVNALSAAVGDLDGDPTNGLEVVLGKDAWHADGSKVSRRSIKVAAGSAILADCGDGDLDTMVSTRSLAATLKTGILGFHPDGGRLEGYPKSLFGETGDAGAPTIGDFDGDGVLDLAVAIEDYSYGGVVSIYRMDGPNHDEHHHWPMLGHDIRHTGAYALPPPNRPAHLTVTGGAGSSLLRWKNRSEVADGVWVERSATGAPGSYQVIAQLRAGSAAYTDAEAPGPRPFYRVRAVRHDPKTGQAIVSEMSNIATTVP